VLIEAMACEVAVIGSDSGEIPHVLGDAGRTFPEGDAAALGELLRELWQNPAGRIELGQRGRQRVLERFTQAQIAEQTVQVYQEILT
jgi:glycosyltransferase involved in cell wall biosynthesis